MKLRSLVSALLVSLLLVVCAAQAANAEATSDDLIDISQAIIAPIPDQQYSSNGVRPKPVVTLNGKQLYWGTDFEFTYRDNYKVGTATITAVGIGYYTGTVSATFEIVPADMSRASMYIVSPQMGYVGRPVSPAVNMKLNGNYLSKDRDYTLTFENNTEVGTATIIATGIGNYVGECRGTYEIVRTDINYLDYGEIPDQPYTGEAVTPKVALQILVYGITLKEDVDYTLEYRDNTEIGTATVIVTGIGGYTGTMELPFEIVKVHAPGWAKENGGYYFYENDGTLRTNAWAQYRDGSWFYLGADGNVVTNGWAKNGKAYYYMGADGRALTNAWVSRGTSYYYVGADGKVVTNDWVNYKGSWYHVDAKGNPTLDNWVKYNGTWYYFNSKGVCTFSLKAS